MQIAKRCQLLITMTSGSSCDISSKVSNRLRRRFRTGETAAVLSSDPTGSLALQEHNISVLSSLLALESLAEGCDPGGEVGDGKGGQG